MNKVAFNNRLLAALAGGLIAGGLMLSAATGVAADKGKLSHSDKAFLKDAYQGGLAEIKSGEMAKNKATNPEVKKLGEMLIKDHQKANDELKMLAESKGVELPDDPSLVQQGKLKLLEKKDAAEFDKAFAEHAVNDHKSDIKAFEKASNDAEDADVKAFASKTLPALREHLSHAEKAGGGK